MRLHHLLQIVRSLDWSWTTDHIQRMFQDLANSGLLVLDKYVHDETMVTMHFSKGAMLNTKGFVQLLKNLHTQESSMNSYMLTRNNDSIVASWTINGQHEEKIVSKELPTELQLQGFEYIRHIWKNNLGIEVVLSFDD